MDYEPGKWSAEQLASWAAKLAADDWSRSTWNTILIQTGYILLWLWFLVALVIMIYWTIRRRANRPDGEKLVAFFFLTWLVALPGHDALFGIGAYAYGMYYLLGPELFASVHDWTYKYMTLFGFVLWG